MVRLDPSRRRTLRMIAAFVGAAGVGISALLLLLGTDGHPIGLGLALVPEVTAAALVTALVRGVASTRLEISDSGLDYHAWGTWVSARWADVDGLTRVAHGPFAGEGPRFRARPSIRGPLVARLVAPTAGIPLAPFVLQVPGSWLHAEVRRRAPHLAG